MRQQTGRVGTLSAGSSARKAAAAWLLSLALGAAAPAALSAAEEGADSAAPLAWATLTEPWLAHAQAFGGGSGEIQATFEFLTPQRSLSQTHSWQWQVDRAGNWQLLNQTERAALALWSIGPHVYVRYGKGPVRRKVAFEMALDELLAGSALSFAQCLQIFGQLQSVPESPVIVAGRKARHVRLQAALGQPLTHNPPAPLSLGGVPKAPLPRWRLLGQVTRFVGSLDFDEKTQHLLRGSGQGEVSIDEGLNRRSQLRLRCQYRFEPGSIAALLPPAGARAEFTRSQRPKDALPFWQGAAAAKVAEPSAEEVLESEEAD